MSTNKPTSLTVYESPSIPFNIELRDADGRTVKSYPREAFTSRDKSISDVMSGRHQDPEHRQIAIEANRRQLEAVHLEAAGPDLLEAIELGLEYWAHRQQRYKNRQPAWVEKARASIAKAKGVAL